MSTLKATNIKNESSASNNIVLDSGGGVVVSGILTATTFSGNVSGNITIGAGSTSAPSLAPSGDSNTGIFFPSADTIAFAEGGTESSRFDSSGRLLIGTASAYTDVIGGAGGYTGSLWIASADSTRTGPFISAWTSSSSLDQMGTSIVLSRSKGNVVGTHGALASGNAIGSISFNGSDGSKFVSGAVIRAEIDGGVSTNDLPGRLVFFTTADGASSPTERVRILSNGGFRATTTGSYENTSAPHHEFVTTGNSNIMNIYHTDSNGGNCGGLYIKFTNAAPNGTGLAYRFDDNAAMRFLVRTNGGIANYQANDSNLCDEREKKNIVDLDSTWDCLKHWELKKFHYNEDDNDSDLRYGVIAQQISLHCPEVITEWVKQDASEAVLDEDGNEIEPAKEEIVRLAVKEQQMYWMAIKALQEAQERIETLEAQNAAILARLDAAGL